MKCKYCESPSCIKYARQKDKQRYRCKSCNKFFLESYSLSGAKPEMESQIIICVKNGLGIRNIARILRISKTTVSNKIKAIAQKITKPRNFDIKGKYEIDEMYSFIGKKNNDCWIIYALERTSRRVVDFVVGRRTSANAKLVIDKVLNHFPTKIFTDRLNLYPNLISPKLHSRKLYGTIYIERNNLTMRTNLRRLQRRTICFSRSKLMLVCCLKIFFWG